MTEPETEVPPRRLSDIVNSLDTQQDLTIGTLVDAFGERAFGALMFVFAVPNIVPTPPGTSAVLGLPLVILTFQLMIGRQALWLPEAIRRRSIKASMVASFATRAVPVMARFEKILKPRLSLFVNSDPAERLIGIIAFLLAVVLFLPIPFLNILPAAAIACMALGLAERDGLAVLAGYAVAAGCAVLMMAISTALVAAARTFFNVLLGG
ncbi:exopolysaccharide biosynthesis protein [Aestuariivirga sp.]|uniref:exopolysaccharide biosynthesis protein n=1 Tax=Aestuariivirga sp. TaxID=2650926 RepID=UPI0035934622